MEATVPPLSLDDIARVLQKKRKPTQFFTYKELPESRSDLAALLLSFPPRFLFYTDAAQGEIGHWTAMRREGRHIWWFSSYGFLPDGELMVSPLLRNAQGQGSNKIAEALRLLQQSGYVIHYSSVPLQNLRVPTTSCGIWCLMFLTSKINNFESFEDKLLSLSIPEKYAAAIYKKEFGDRS